MIVREALRAAVAPREHALQVDEVFRIPTPVLGAGLIEAIPDSAILANMNANAAMKRQRGHLGTPQSQRQ